MQSKAREYGCTIKVEEERGRYVETHEGYTLPRWVPENAELSGCGDENHKPL